MKSIIEGAAINYNEALKKIERNDLSGSIDLLEKSIQLYSKDHEAFNLLGLAYYIRSDFNSAKKCWNDSLFLLKENNKAKEYLDSLEEEAFVKLLEMYNNSIKTYQNGEYEKALQGISTVILEMPDLSEPYEIQIDCYQQLDMYQKAEEARSMLKKIDSSSRKLSERVADHQLSKLNQATKQYKRVAVALGALATILIGINASQYINRTDAATMYQDMENKFITEISAINQNYEELIKKNESLLSALKEDNAKEVVNYNGQQNFELLIDDEAQTFNTAWNLYRSKEYEKASAIFNKLIEYGTQEYLVRESVYFSASAYEKLGQVENAVNAYSQYITDFQGTNYYDDSLYQVGILLYKIGDREGSKKMLTKLINEEPKSIFNNTRVRYILSQ